MTKRSNGSALKEVFGWLGFKKPWFYLFICCYFIMMLIVLFGNPLLPIPALAYYGWSWHHIPEILASVFSGMWVGSWRFPFRKLNIIPLMLIVVISIEEFIRKFSMISWAVFIIGIIPLFAGYLIVRFGIWINKNTLVTSTANPKADFLSKVSVSIFGFVVSQVLLHTHGWGMLTTYPQICVTKQGCYVLLSLVISSIIFILYWWSSLERRNNWVKNIQGYFFTAGLDCFFAVLPYLSYTDFLI